MGGMKVAEEQFLEDLTTGGEVCVKTQEVFWRYARGMQEARIVQ